MNQPVPFFHEDARNGVSHAGLYAGNARWFQYHWASGLDIALIELVREGGAQTWPEASAGGLATGLFTLTPDVNQIMHYGYGDIPLTNASYVCFEGASDARIHVIATNNANGTNGNRCGPVRVGTNDGNMRELTGPFSGVCGGDSGGLVHSNSSPVGIVAYGGLNNCGTSGTGYALLTTNLAAYPGATILGWPSQQRATLEPESAPGSCIHRHANGNTGAPDGGWLQQVPSPYFPWLTCSPADASKQWRMNPANAYSTGDVYTIDSHGYCMRTPNGYPANGDIEVQWSCNDGSPIKIESAPGNAGWFFMRSMHNPTKCLSVRDPYNGNDPHWIHNWDCYTNHPAQKWRAIG